MFLSAGMNSAPTLRVISTASLVFPDPLAPNITTGAEPVMGDAKPGMLMSMRTLLFESIVADMPRLMVVLPQ
jgi:hypothetical protein